MMGGRIKEVVISVEGCVRLVLVYIPIARKYVKIFPTNNSNNNSDHQPEITVFDEKRGREIIKNYEKLHNATVIIQTFRGFRDYSKVKINSNDIKLNELFNGKKVCITA